jgi:hypothetical protein
MAACNPEAQLRVTPLHGGILVGAAIALLEVAVGRFAVHGVEVTRDRSQSWVKAPWVLFGCHSQSCGDHDAGADRLTPTL